MWKECSDNSGIPDASLNPLALLVRPASSTTPSKITITNLKVIDLKYGHLEPTMYLNYYIPSMAESKRLKFLYGVSFTPNTLNPYMRSTMSFNI